MTWWCRGGERSPSRTWAVAEPTPARTNKTTRVTSAVTQKAKPRGKFLYNLHVCAVKRRLPNGSAPDQTSGTSPKAKHPPQRSGNKAGKAVTRGDAHPESA